MADIKIFYHCCELPGANELAKKQIDRVRQSGLLENGTLFLCINGDLVHFFPLLNYIESYPNIRVCHVSDTITSYEYPTLEFLKTAADNSEKDDYYLYFHTKGLSYRNNQGLDDWRKFMEYWLVDHWKLCVGQLDIGFETCGTNYINGTYLGIDRKPATWPHYTGNFWWARSSYIRRLEYLPNPKTLTVGPSRFTNYRIDPDINNWWKFDHEAWIASGKPKWKEIASSPGGMKGYPGWHYHNLYPESEYTLLNVSAT